MNTRKIKSINPMMDIKRAIGFNVKFYRQESRLSQEELGNLAGISTSALSDIETGASDPKATTLYKISEALHINIGQLFDKEILDKQIKWRFDLKHEEKQQL